MERQARNFNPEGVAERAATAWRLRDHPNRIPVEFSVSISKEGVLEARRVVLGALDAVLGATLVLLGADAAS